jgi:hypothetical protein
VPQHVTDVSFLLLGQRRSVNVNEVRGLAGHFVRWNDKIRRHRERGPRALYRVRHQRNNRVKVLIRQFHRLPRIAGFDRGDGWPAKAAFLLSRQSLQRFGTLKSRSAK